MRHLDEGECLTEELVTAIVARADGNPMYIAQVTGMVLSADSGEGLGVHLLDSVPATLHEVLMARLDGIGRSRSIIQHAAAIGRTFSYRLLVEVVEGPDARRLPEELAARVAADADIAKLFVLGVGMRTHTGVARRMFGALAQRGINISMINTSEVRVSAVVDRSRGEEALACLRAAFDIQ